MAGRRAMVIRALAALLGGSLIPGAIVAATGNFEAGIMSVVAGALLASVTMLALGRALRY